MSNYKPILIILSLLFFISCNSNIDNTSLIEKEVNNRIRILIKNKIEKCRRNALEDAEIHVDSIISEITQNSVNKGIDFPEKPVKKDTDSLSFNIEIDSINLEKVIDSLRLLRDTTHNDKKN